MMHLQPSYGMFHVTYSDEPMQNSKSIETVEPPATNPRPLATAMDLTSLKT